MEELWVGVKGLEDRYRVSNFGNTQRITKDGWVKLAQCSDPNGYMRVVFSLNGKVIKWLVHRLVAIHFIPIPEELKVYNISELQINHKDYNPGNNRIDNLEWCTPKYNVEYSLNKPITQFDLNGNFIKNWKNSREALHFFNCQVSSSISQALNGYKYTWKGYIWRFTQPEYKPGFVLDVSNINTTGKIKAIRISQFNLSGEFIRSWDSALQASKELNIDISTIRGCIHGDSKSAGGFMWREYDSEHQLKDFKLPKYVSNSPIWDKSRAVSQFSETGEYIQTFPSMSAAYSYNKTFRTTDIGSCCEGIRKTCGGFIWKYAKPYHIPGFNILTEECNGAYFMPVIQKTDRGNIVAKYPSLKDAYLTVSPISTINGWREIYECCMGRRKLAFQYKWEFEKE